MLKLLNRQFYAHQYKQVHMSELPALFFYRCGLVASGLHTSRRRSQTCGAAPLSAHRGK